MNRVRHDRIRLYMKKADSFCVRGSVEYPVEMELGSFRTMTVLFIMILPEQEMGLKKLVEHQCGIPDTGAKYFFNNEETRTEYLSINAYLRTDR